MSKEEILAKYPQFSRPDFGLAGDVTSKEYMHIKNVEQAMDFFAKQEVIEALKFAGNSKSNAEHLYSLYLQSKQSKT